MANWPFTNQMRQIMVFDGDGDKAYEQGTAIWNLGWDMTYASQTLRQLASGDDGQQGKAVDALRKKVGDADETLELAGKLYRPLGLALRGYGNEVRNGIQTQIDTCHQTASDRWQEYIDLPGEKDGRDYFLGIGKPDEGSQEETDNDAEDAAKLQAWNDWEDAAGAYDTAFDTWEDAWDAAIEKIDDAFTDDLKDSRWEDAKGWIKIALEVLKWAGLVIGIAALIIGGPIIAAIAAVIAVATIILTVVMAIDGDGSWEDVAWAAVDIVPFGKAGKFAKILKGGDKATELKKFVKADVLGDFTSKTYKDGWKAVKDWGTTGANKTGWQKYAGEGANTGWQDSVVKSITGKNITDWDEVEKGMPGSIYEMYHAKGEHLLKIEGWGNTIYNQATGGDRESVRDRNPIVKTVW